MAIWPVALGFAAAAPLFAHALEKLLKRRATRRTELLVERAREIAGEERER